MVLQNALTQTLYAQLHEEAASYAAVIFERGVIGSPYSIEVKGRRYWYWQASQPDGKLRKMLLGTDDDRTRSVVANLKQRKQDAAESIASLKKTASAFLASGGMANEPAHFRVIEKLAMAGLFRKGLFLVGSHAFVALGNLLGVHWAATYRTTDIDFARADSVALAVSVDSGENVAVPDTAREADPSFFEVCALDVREPSVSLASNRTKVRIDFLTAQRRPGDTKPRYFEDLKIAARPLPFMDYLLGGTLTHGLIIGAYAIPVSLPDPARFAIHKLIVARLRPLAQAAKAAKDLRQAEEMLLALNALGREDLVQDALDGLRTHGSPTATAHVRKSAERICGEARDIVLARLADG